MTLDGCHMCREPDVEQAMVGDFLIKELVPDFYGKFDIVLNQVMSRDTDQKTLQATLQFKVQDEQVTSQQHFISL